MTAIDYSSMTMWTQIGDLPHRLEYLTIGRWRTRVLSLGEGEETVVLLNGTSGHIEAWTRNIRAMAEKYRVVAYDYPGHGFSTLASGDLVIKDYMDHLDGLLDALELDHVHLAGESLGGWVAIKYALTRPERLRSIILSAPGGRMIKRSAMDRVSPVSAKAVKEPTPENVRERLAVVIHNKEDISDELVEMRRAVYGREGFYESMEAIMALQVPEIREANKVTDQDYADIRVPTLLIWSDHEPTGGAGTGERLAALIPNGELVIVPDSAHWPQWESPTLVNEKILNFIGGVQNDRAA